MGLGRGKVSGLGWVGVRSVDYSGWGWDSSSGCGFDMMRSL